jgi:hypothetical protein
MCEVRKKCLNIQNFSNYSFILSFGHSCYGGFGKKRSDPAVPLDPQQDIEVGPLMKTFPQLNSLPSPQQLQVLEEKEVKLIILSTLSQVVEETLKRISIDVEK